MRVGIVAEGHDYFIDHDYIEHESRNRRRGSDLREVAKVAATAEWLPKPSDPHEQHLAALLYNFMNILAHLYKPARSHLRVFSGRQRVRVFMAHVHAHTRDSRFGRRMQMWPPSCIFCHDPGFCMCAVSRIADSVQAPSQSFYFDLLVLRANF